LIGFELDVGFSASHTKKRTHLTFITLNSTRKGLFTTADLT